MSIPKVTELVSPGSTFEKNNLDRHKRQTEESYADNSNFTMEHRTKKERKFCEEGGM